jgi:hypothetical protein
VRIRNTAISVVILTILLITFSAFYGYFINVKDGFFPSERSALGQFGDYFGGVLNPIFGFASFLALLVTIIYQAKELKLSRTELELTRNELAHSAIALMNQNKAIELQSFEQTFFSWLDTYKKLVTGFFYSDEKKGQIAMLYVWKIHIRKTAGDDINTGNRTTNFNEMMTSWNKLYDTQEIQLDSLFRTIYSIIFWIDSQDDLKLNRAKKWMYISIVRSQLSWIEMAFLYLNGLTDRGAKFKKLAEKYALFNNLTFEENITRFILKPDATYSTYYLNTAFNSDEARQKLGLPESAEETFAIASRISKAN